MEKANFNIKCDVATCRHNCEGKNCCLDTVRITCDSVGCTCCHDYSGQE
ncbi:MAG: DUF1540 domain-containing protein [Clostridia bacterium]|nr:DUF1540 domain-containing protein [Clostridia bacterium]